MNTYLVPIYNDNLPSCFIKKYIAQSFEDCKDKIMYDFSDQYDQDFSDWEDFCFRMWEENGIFIGSIKDIEEI